jgi:hypothetical protein
VEDMLRNICFFQVRISHVLRFIFTVAYLLNLPRAIRQFLLKISFPFLRELFNDAVSVFRLYSVG